MRRAERDLLARALDDIDRRLSRLEDEVDGLVAALAAEPEPEPPTPTSLWKSGS